MFTLQLIILRNGDIREIVVTEQRIIPTKYNSLLKFIRRMQEYCHVTFLSVIHPVHLANSGLLHLIGIPYARGL